MNTTVLPEIRSPTRTSDLQLILYEKQRRENVAKEFDKKRQNLESEFRKFDEEFEAETKLNRQKYMLNIFKKITAYEEDIKALQSSIHHQENRLQHNSLSATSKLREIETKHQRIIEEQQKKLLEQQMRQLLEERNQIESIFNQCLQSLIAIEAHHKNDQILHTIKHDLQTIKTILQNMDFLLNNRDLRNIDLKSAHGLKQEVLRLQTQITSNIEAVKRNKMKSEESKASDQRNDTQNVIQVTTTQVTPSLSLSREQVSHQSQSVDVIREYLKLQKISNDFDESFKRFATESGFKQKKNDLQLFVKTTINTISSESVEHIKDKLNRLSQLFSEKPVESSGRQVKCSHSDGSLPFAMSLASKMFISVCTKQKDIAMTMGPIISLLWQRFPSFGQIFLAQLQEKCPYSVPFYPEKESDENETDYLIACGYTISKDGTQETEESFLNRMRAMIRLYSAIIQCNLESAHPHGLKCGWSWVARVLNQEPRPAITAAILDAFLSISSHKMYRFYGRQFVKLIEFIQRDYTKRIESVTTKDTKRQSLVKLQMFSDNLCNKIRRNASHKDLAPEGLVPDYFFKTSSFSRGMSFNS